MQSHQVILTFKRKTICIFNVSLCILQFFWLHCCISSRSLVHQRLPKNSPVCQKSLLYLCIWSRMQSFRRCKQILTIFCSLHRIVIPSYLAIFDWMQWISYIGDQNSLFQCFHFRPSFHSFAKRKPSRCCKTQQRWIANLCRLHFRS